MVKKRNIRQKLKDKKTKEDSSVNKAEKGEESEDNSLVLNAAPHVRRKVVKQARFLEGLEKTHKYLAVHKPILKKKKKRSIELESSLVLDGIADLANVLPNLNSSQDQKQLALDKKPKVLKAKTRKKITLQETKQFQAVISNPIFQKNPFGALQKHLENTLPPPPPPLKVPQKGKKDRKKTPKKNSGNDMDIF